MTTTTPAAQAPFSAERWQQFWNAWKAQPQQLEGIEQLRLAVISADPAILTEAAPWRQTFSSDLQSAPLGATPPAPPAPEAPAHANPLPVAWENQNDNASGTGYRECFSSSCAMLARYWGKVSSDDEYNAIRAKYGDCPASSPLADWRQSSWPVRGTDRPPVVAGDNRGAMTLEATRKLSHLSVRAIASTDFL